MTTFDHRTTQLHVHDLQREIEGLRIERAIAARTARPGVIDRARQGVGRALIAAGVALGGRDATLRTHRA